jgi:hypothetical protein
MCIIMGESKKSALFLLVQIGLTIVGSSRTGDARKASTAAIDLLSGILALDERDIPEGVEVACQDLINWHFSWQDGKNNKYPCPIWYQPRLHHGTTKRVYPWSSKK